MNLQEKLVSIRRTIHKNPELGNNEYKTTAFIEQILKKSGIKTKRITKTGIIGLIVSEKHKAGPCIAIRADIDALPIVEKTNAKYSSTNHGIMHACGHDANAAMVLGAAMILSEQKHSLKGNVKFIFQPSEETGGGAKQLIKSGVLKNPKVDAIIGVHVNPWLKSGVLGIKYDEMMAAVDKFTIDIIGCGGHGAYPHLGKDAVVISAQVILALQSIVSREIDPVEPVVITVGKVEGGQSFNILCDKVRMIGTVRTLSEKIRAKVKAQINKKLYFITKAYGGDYRFYYEKLESPLKNTKNLLQIAEKSAKAIIGRNNVSILAKPSMGGEDFAEYLKYVPGCFLYMGAQRKVVYPWHHEKFDIDESVLSKGAKLLADMAKRYLNK